MIYEWTLLTDVSSIHLLFSPVNTLDPPVPFSPHPFDLLDDHHSLIISAHIVLG